MKIQLQHVIIIIIIIIIYTFWELGLHTEKEQRVRVFEHREFRKTFGLKVEEKRELEETEQ